MYSLLHLWKERSAFAALAKASIANITHAQRRGIIFSCSGKQTGRQRVQSMKGVYGFARHLSASGIHFWHSSGGVLRFSARLPSRIFREWTGTHSQTRRTQSRRLKHARLDAKDGGCARDTRMSHPTDQHANRTRILNRLGMRALWCVVKKQQGKPKALANAGSDERALCHSARGAMIARRRQPCSLGYAKLQGFLTTWKLPSTWRLRCTRRVPWTCSFPCLELT